MTRALFAISGSATALLPRPFISFGHAFEGFWHKVGHRLFNGYHPERHYMRGPGPAWRAKHGADPAL